jgi:rhodanese-related sulfurtransferase
VLDVRPTDEAEVVGIKDAVAVPLFEVDDGMDIGSLMSQMAAFGMGGWWEGTKHMKANPQFMAKVQAKIPKDAKVIVTCQKGLRCAAPSSSISSLNTIIKFLRIRGFLRAPRRLFWCLGSCCCCGWVELRNSRV